MNSEIGHLLHKPGGPEHARWVFDYGSAGTDDEAGYRFAAHAFRLGNTSRSATRTVRLITFRVVSVTPAT